MIGRKVPVVLDPTLLLSAQEWLTAFGINAARHVKRKIIFSLYLKYAVDPSPIIYKLIGELQLRTGAEVVYIGDSGCEKIYGLR